MPGPRLAGLRQWAQVFGIALLLLLFAPFNLDRATTYATEDLFFQTIAFDYPRGRSPRIDLVLADDDTLAATRPDAAGPPRLPPAWDRWPLPLQAWADTLRLAQLRGARHILLDVGLLDPRPPDEVDALADAVIAAAASSDVYLVASPALERGLPDDLARRVEGRPRVHLVSVRRAKDDGPHDAYPLLPAGSRPAAALEIARAYCEGRRHSVCLRDADAWRGASQFQVWWRAPPDPSWCLNAPEDEHLLRGCRWVAPNGAIRFAQLFWAGLSTEACDRFDPDRSGIPCRIGGVGKYAGLPFRTHRLEDFAGRPRPGAEPIRVGEIVIISSRFAYARDEVSGPVYDHAPGAAMHAMAIDNLVSLDGRVFTRNLPLRLSPFAFDVACLAVACVAAALAHHLFGRRLGIKGLRLFLLDLLATFVIAVVACGIALLTRTSPANWVGILLTTATVSTAIRLRGAHAQA